MDEPKWQVDEWRGCYPSQWKGLVVPEAMAHPAKFSSRLIRRIYDHLRAEGWVKEGDYILDPFGGVALGALDAMRMGLHWRGVELEPKFHRIGQENIWQWDFRFASMPHWGGAALYRGDSRELLKAITAGTFESVVSSPPFMDKLSADRVDPESRRKLAREKGISNAEYISPIDMEAIGGRAQKDARYGFEQGQLGAMKDGGFEASISSPPFRQSEGGTPEPKPGGAIDKRLYARHAAGNSAASGYGETDGQLANLPEGNFDAAVSSPPYEGTDLTYKKNGLKVEGKDKYERPYMAGQSDQNYGETQENIGNKSGTDFWLAARTIVEQVFLALAPGGHAVWVCKDFVKHRVLSPFSNQWRQLCEAVGFVTLHEHRALLVHGRQGKLDGGVKVHESKSFFRRLAEKNGSPRVDWETVWCMEKPK